jgi:hypothetical protein
MNASAQFGADARGMLTLPRGSQRDRSAIRSLLAAVCIMTGLLRIVSFVWLFMPGGPWKAFSQLLPISIGSVSVGEGLFWIGLGAGVWSDEASRIRSCLALILAAEGCASMLWAMSPIALMQAGTLIQTPAPELAFNGVLYFALALGIGRAHEWGRRGAVVVGIAFGVNQIAISVVASVIPGRIFPPLSPPVLVIETMLALVFPVGLILYGASNHARADFAAARAARDRVRIGDERRAR